MEEKLTIKREWSSGYPAYVKVFTLSFLLSLQEALDLEDLSGNGDDFTEFITGLHCDSYADQACDSLHTIWVDCYSSRSDLTEVEKSNIHEYLMLHEDEYKTCYTVYRIWNNRLSQEEALSTWKRDCIATLEDIIEE